MLREVIKLVRVKQWYKNLLIFLALIFAGKALSYGAVASSVMGFIALCLVSGAVYVFNDLKDLGKDRMHPEKKLRPLPSGKIKPLHAFAIGIIFLAAGIGLSLLLPTPFLITVLAIIGTNVAYTALLQRILFVDVLTIALLFVLRAVAGAVIINVVISPWLLLCTFLLALFLAIAKRKTDLAAYKGHYRKDEEYQAQELDLLLTSCLAMLLLSYSIYSFFTQTHSQLFWLTVPVAFFLGFRFLHFVVLNHTAAKRAEEVFYEKEMIAGMVAWTAIVLFAIYG